ncbi:MAG: acetoacetate decarboxylase family protein, partial [Kosmotogaceae bacterium]
MSGKKGKFVFNADFIYKMPVHFGGAPFYPVRVVYGDNTVISVDYETDENALLRYIPEDFELKEPVVSVQYTNCRDVDWMIGGEYRLIQVTTPVKYVGNSEDLEGVYALVVWENKTCPIIGGREEDGVPKVFADISSERHLENHWFVAASYEQFTFLKIDLQRGDEVSEEDLSELNK